MGGNNSWPNNIPIPLMGATEEQKRTHIKELMKARRAVRTAQQHGDDDALRQARDAVQAAKEALGERGPVWWDDNAPDEGGFAPHNSSYAKWWESQL